MSCVLPGTLSTFGDFLVWPTLCFYHFWTVILAAIFVILTLTIYNRERDDNKEGDLISIMAMTSLATSFLAGIGSLVKNSDLVPMIQQDVLLYFLAFTVVFVVIWLLRKDN